MRNEKRQLTEGIRTTKWTKNQNVRGKGNLQILGNIGSNTIKQVEMKKKKIISGERENYSKSNFIADISPKG